MNPEERSFLRKDIRSVPLGDGGFVEAFSLQSERGENTVLKEYREEELKNLILEKDEVPSSLEGYIELLRKREQEVAELYPRLKSFVVPTSYFIASGKNGKPAIFAIQERIGSTDTNWPAYVLQEVKEQALALPAEKRKALAEDLRYLTQRSEELVFGKSVQEGYQSYGHEKRVPDILHGNIRLSAEGDLRIIDTNMFLDLNWDDEGDLDFQELMVSFSELADELEQKT